MTERSWSDTPTTRTVPALTDRKPVMKQFTNRTVVVGVSSAVALGLASGVAYAFWSASGTGAGTGQAASMVAPSIFAGAVPAGTLLYPGLTANGTSVGGDLSIKVTNTNPFPVTITGIAPGTGNVTSDKGSACQDGTPNVTGASVITKSSGLTGTNLTIAAGAVQTAVTINKVVSLSTASADGCQGAQINFPSTYIVLSFSS